MIILTAKDMLAIAKDLVPLADSRGPNRGILLGNGFVRVASTAQEAFATYKVEADLPPCVVSARSFGDLARFEHDAEFSLDGQTLTVKIGSRRVTLPTILEVGDLPEPPEFTRGAAIEIDPTLSARVLCARSTDPHRALLGGIHLDAEDLGDLRLVATDTYRLHVQAIVADARADGLVSRTLQPALLRRGTIEFAAPDSPTKDRSRLSDGRLTILAADRRGTYPKWRRVIPEDAPERRFAIDRSALAPCLREALPYGVDRVVLEGDGKVLTISASTDDGRYRAEIPLVSPEFAFAAGGKWLLELLAQTGAETTIQFEGPTRPLRFDGADGFVAALMPKAMPS